MNTGYKIALILLSTFLTLLMEVGVPIIIVAFIAIIFGQSFSWILVIFIYIIIGTFKDVSDTVNILEKMIEKK